MSPTKQISRDSQMFNFDSKLVVRAMRFMLTAAIVLALAYPASAAAVSWTRTSASGVGYWSNTGNWSTGSVPGNTDDVTFGNSGTQVYSGPPPTITNVVDHSITIKSLIYAPTLNAQCTDVAPSILMKISGAATPPSTWGVDGSSSLWACASASGANDTSLTLFTGGGQMDISSSTSGNTGGDIVVNQVNPTAGTHNSVLDLSGLSSFNANVDQILISFTGTTDTSMVDRPNGTMYLAQTNTITLNNTNSYTNSGNSFVINTIEGGLILGFAGNHATGQTTFLYLGQTNTINVQNVYVAGRRQTAVMRFNPAYSGTSPTLKMRGIDGTSRVTQISIGDNTGNGTGATNIADGTMDLTGGIADIQVSTLVMGTSTCSTTTNASYGGRGTLTFNGGTVDATSIILGNMTVDLNTNRTGTGSADQGTLNVNGTANLIVGTGGIKLGKGPTPSGGMTAGISTGTLNIRGTATVTLGANILAGGIPQSPSIGSYSNISMTGGTLNMQGNYIGYDGSTIIPITNFTVSGGSITNLGGLYVTNFRVNNNYTLNSEPLTITNTGYYNGTIDMRNSATNTFNVSNLTLPAGVTYYTEFSSSGAGNDQVAATDLYLNGGTNYVSVSPLGTSFSTGTYHVITYTTKHNSGGAVTWITNNTTRNKINDPVDNGSGSIDITIATAVPGNTLTWAGTAGTTAIWDWATTSNWTSGSPPGADKYYDLDALNFTGGTPGTATTVNINNTITGAVAGFYPSSITVNSDNDYVIAANSTAGINRISGTTTLLKQGTGTLTINMSNDYSGTTTVSGGKLRLGPDGALGSSPLVINGGTDVSPGGTLDINHGTLGGRSVTVSGVGAGGLGVIVNNSTSTYTGTITSHTADLPSITLSGDATFGGTCTTSTNNSGLPSSTAGRWEMYNADNPPSISTSGNAYNLTKVGNNLIVLYNTNVDTVLANVNLKAGILRLEGSTNLGNPAGTVTVDGTGIGQTGNSTDAGLFGTVLELDCLTTPLNKNITLKNNGAIYVVLNPGDSTGANTVVGPIAVESTGGVINAGGVRTDLDTTYRTPAARMYLNGAITEPSGAVLTKLGPGSITLGGSSSFAGTINHKDGTLIVNNYMAGSLTMFNNPTQGTTTTLTGTGTVALPAQLARSPTHPACSSLREQPLLPEMWALLP